MIFNRKVLLAVTFSAGVFFRAAAAAEGKSSKGTKSQSNPIPLYFLNPSSCPQKCAQCRRREVDDDDGGHGTGEAVQPCDAENKHQMWRLHQKDGLTMIESYFNPGDCLAVVPPQAADGLGAAAGSVSTMFDMTRLRVPAYFNLAGDGWVVDDMCHHSSVGLASCNNPEAQWIFNGANLISALCWKNGISSFLTVNEECSELSVMAADGGNDALLRSQTFMLTEQDFIETIVPVSTDEEDPNDSDQMRGSAKIQDLLWNELPEPVTGTEVEVGALPEPNDNDEPVVPAQCNPTCENGKVCAKHSSNEAGGKCYTKCPNDAITDRRCETPNETCVHHYSHANGITSWCDCETDGKGGKWVCKAK